MSDTGGTWRTVSGRRVFIRDGQSLSDAMKESGKFENSSKGSTEDRRFELGVSIARYGEEYETAYSDYEGIQEEYIMQREPTPEPIPLTTTICKGSFSESFLVQLFSKPQQEQASRTKSEP